MVTLLMSLTSFSQTGTTNCKVHLSCDKAKQIAADLLSGDQAKIDLKTTQQILSLTEQKGLYKDSIIKSFEAKDTNYKTQISLYSEKEKSYNKIITGLEQSNKRYKTGMKSYRMISIVLGAATLACMLGK